jgi:hypothetical protein
MRAGTVLTFELLAVFWFFGAIGLSSVRIPYVRDVREESVQVADLYKRAYVRARPKILGAWVAFGVFEFLAFVLARIHAIDVAEITTTVVPCLRSLGECMAIASLTLAITFVFGGSNLMGHLLMRYQTTRRSQRAVKLAGSVLRRSTVIAGVMLLLPTIIVGYLGAPTDVTVAIAAALIMNPGLDSSTAELDRVMRVAAELKNTTGADFDG